MFEIQQILTKRKKSPSMSYDLIYEWEDVLSKQMSLPLVDENQLLYNRIVRLVPLLPKLMQTNTVSIVFDIYPNLINRGNNKANIVPAIVDFYHKDPAALNQFYSSYANNKVVLISSMEVYEFLKRQNCPLNIKHWALSISDKYQLDDAMKTIKDLDLILMGRPNKVLQAWTDEYAKKHPSFVYGYRVYKDGHWICQNSKGETVGCIDDRDGYIQIMRKAKCGLYHTPGMDGGEERTHGFNQVTPRFLEYLVNGCHVISRYPKNADVEFYELDKMTSNVNLYEEFEKALDYACNNPIDVDKYQTYLDKHYTSVRASELNKILKSI